MAPIALESFISTGLGNKLHHHFLAPKNYPDWNSPRTQRSYDAASEQSFSKQKLEELSYMFGNGCANERQFSYCSELLVWLALTASLQLEGVIVDHAPEELERGDPHIRDKGIDLIVSHLSQEGDREPLLGINVKLGKKRPDQLHERTFHSPRLNIPYTNCSLGSWRVDSWEREDVDVRTWMLNYVVPNMKAGKDVPHLGAFREFVMSNLTQTLTGYYEKAQLILEGFRIQNEEERNLLPVNPEQTHIFMKRLEEVTEIFYRNT